VVVDPVGGAFERVLWYGAAAAGRVQVTERFATALRGEFYQDLDGFTTPTAMLLGTGTVTLEFAPLPYLLIKADIRYDGASEGVFAWGSSGTTQHQGTFTLGVVMMAAKE
jgi:hypothetical protein